MSIPSSLNGFDVDAAIARMLGQPELWWTAVGLFVQHFADWENEWLAVRGDDAQESKKVHALRSAAANIGADKLSCGAAVLEDLIVMRLAGKDIFIPPSVRWYVQDCFREVWRSASDARLRDSLSLEKSA